MWKILDWLLDKKKNVVLNPANANILIECNFAGDVHITSYWPLSTNQEELQTWIHHIMATMLVVNDGTLFELMQQAVRVYGQISNDEETANRILGLIDIQLQEKKARAGIEEEEPLIAPTSVFQQKEGPS